jgi:hypothetical protein
VYQRGAQHTGEAEEGQAVILVLLRALHKGTRLTPGKGPHKLNTWLEEQNIFLRTELSNANKQLQDGISEKLVDTLGKGIRTLLLTSQLPPEFGGAAALYYTDVYNHLPHASLHNLIPHTVHHSKQANVSWFRPFGCRATIFRGRDLVEHHKLAPRGEQVIFLGLGLAHCSKCWLVWSPRLNTIYASRNVTFDETLFPLKTTDQCIYCHCDNVALTEMRADAYGTTAPTNMYSPALSCQTRFGVNPALVNVCSSRFFMVAAVQSLCSRVMAYLLLCTTNMETYLLPFRVRCSGPMSNMSHVIISSSFAYVVGEAGG